MGRHVVIGPDPKVKQNFRPAEDGGRPRTNSYHAPVPRGQDGGRTENAGFQPRPEIKPEAKKKERCVAYEKIVPGIPAQPKPAREKKPVKDESPVSPLYGKVAPQKVNNNRK